MCACAQSTQSTSHDKSEHEERAERLYAYVLHVPVENLSNLSVKSYQKRPGTQQHTQPTHSHVHTLHVRLLCTACSADAYPRVNVTEAMQ